MGVPFDHIAFAYDSVFTHSAIGQLQRKRVWEHIEQVIPQLNGIEMLELNCGTGEDAMLFSEKGFNIIATDISEEMLKVTNQKAKQYSMQHRISSQYLDLDNFNETLFDKKFDLIFSNFGGLNCINPESLKRLFEKLPAILAPHGRFIGVIMPKFCIWESLYFFLKFQLKKAMRRNTSAEVIANLHGAPVKTWYYSPSQIKSWSSERFKTISIKPIGIALPPSYLEQFFRKKNRLLLLLNALEKRFQRTTFLASLSDHYIIDLQLR